MASARVRYFVNNMDEAIAFYTRNLGFRLRYHPIPGFAILSLGDLDLLLNTPNGPAGAAQPTRDGLRPTPGGWNRFELVVTDLEGEVSRLKGAGVRFRNDITKGIGGSQVVLEDPSGNPVELFQPGPGATITASPQSAD